MELEFYICAKKLGRKCCFHFLIWDTPWSVLSQSRNSMVTSLWGSCPGFETQRSALAWILDNTEPDSRTANSFQDKLRKTAPDSGHFLGQRPRFSRGVHWFLDRRHSRASALSAQVQKEQPPVGEWLTATCTHTNTHHTRTVTSVKNITVGESKKNLEGEKRKNMQTISMTPCMKFCTTTDLNGSWKEPTPHPQPITPSYQKFVQPSTYVLA